MIPQKCQLWQKGPAIPKPIAPPPPVRDSSAQVTSVGEAARRAAGQKAGYASTINPKAPKSLLGTGGGYDTPGSRSLLG